MDYQLIVIGGGPAGLAAACTAWEKGLRRILLLERDTFLGGILNQCIHNGFGLHYFGEELTGPEYAQRFIDRLAATGVEVHCDTMVLEIGTAGAAKTVRFTGPVTGYREVSAETIILAMGCRERTRGAIGLPGTRPAGVLTAGAAQRYVNIDGYLPGRRVVILGSGDIGLIMARRMTLEGAKVLACAEVLPYSGGLARNITQCLEDFDIPLYLSHTITEIRGEGRVTGVTLMKVDENRRPIPGTEISFDCDTVLLSVGLIPENELGRAAGLIMDSHTSAPAVFENRETSIPGVFACGNVLQVHDLVDFVTEESQTAGEQAARLVLEGAADPTLTPVALNPGDGVRYTVPQQLHRDRMDQPLDIFFRVASPTGPCRIQVRSEDGSVASFRRLRTAPGEMEHITLPPALLKKVRDTITVSLEPEA